MQHHSLIKPVKFLVTLTTLSSARKHSISISIG